jgi:hypothetical protein
MQRKVTSQVNIVWTVDFETLVCKLYLLFISANAAQEKEKKAKKVLLPTGVSKSTAHTVTLFKWAKHLTITNLLHPLPPQLDF